MGHVKDLPKSQLGVDIEKDFAPEYLPVEKKQDVVNEILRKAKKAEKIYLATDPDREGEAIASHIGEILANGKKQERIVFHEITKEAVEEALAHPRKVDKALVNAQIARRVLDRLVGYKLSPLLWKKIRRGLSAGRVQSVAVKLIVEREKEIEKFKKDEYWEIWVDLKNSKSQKLQVQLIKLEIKNKEKADEVVGDLKEAKYSVSSVRRREVQKNPYAPFTTSTITQAAANLFSWSAKKTMSAAQKLYEEGLITYHRTDSTNIAGSALAKTRSFIKNEYGEPYLPAASRIYKTKSKTAQEAHEAIRPTNIKKLDEDWPISGKFSGDTKKLYELIWRRFLASQMASSVYDETVVEVAARRADDETQYLLRVSGQIMKFDGWKKVISKTGDENRAQLPEVESGEKLQLIKVNPQQKFTQPPPRYNEASIIKTLEKLGIGRPSTYAPIVSTIQARQYVEKTEGKFFPTPVGIAVTEFLVKNFPDVFEYSFTAEMEDNLDKIADGKAEWQKVMRKFWNPFGKKLGTVEKKSKRVKIETEKLGKKCPECKKGELVIRIGRFGKFISCSRFPDCKFTDKYVEKVGMKCPKCKKGDVIVKKTGKGRRFFGCSRYPDCDFASWKNPKEKEENERQNS